MKVGDKIKLLNNGGYEDQKAGDVLTVTKQVREGVTACKPGRPEVFFLPSEYELLPEESAETELERLVRVANAGFKACDEIRDKYPNEVELSTESCPKWTTFEWAYVSARGLQYRVKPNLVFEPFYVGPFGDAVPHNHPSGEPCWLVRLEGDTLHVGCRTFAATEAKNVLARMCRGKRIGSSLPHEVSATREGMYVRCEHISWADADKILAALEKAGV